MSWTFPMDRLAHRDRQLLACSVVGPSTAIKAFRAALYQGKDVKVRFMYTEPGSRWDNQLVPSEDGYQTLATRLGYSTWHLVAWSKRPDLLLSSDEETLWRVLNASTTTPLIRGWMPWLMTKLRDKRLLRDCQGFGATCCLMTADTPTLDKIVQEAVVAGDLVVARESASFATK